ncbi:MAG: hypothetical protein JSW46_08005 [Gemmatimonadota bacterium]|nr:MAG: hypothetical protein JSW46_08005 [Gemmatimonadota bacterium]
MGDYSSIKWSLWKIVLLIEWICLLIGLAMPITPSKTGGDSSLAYLFFDDPGYLQEVLVYFVLGNLVFGILALIVLVVNWKEKRTGTDDEPPSAL